MKTLRFIALLFLLSIALPAGNVGNGTTTCPSSGPKRISSISLRAIHVTIQAGSSNMGTVALGGSGITTSSGISLSQGDAFTYPPASNSAAYDLTQIWFACSNSSDSINYTYLQ